MIIGGGFFGLSVGLELGRRNQKVLILEANSETMTRASMINQARVHGGYHYPRHLNTALRSRINRPRFQAQYEAAICDNFTHYYAIAKEQSLVSARQFKNTMDLLGSETKLAPASVRQLFDSDRIENVFQVQEPAFDAIRLRELIEAELNLLSNVLIQRNCRFEGLITENSAHKVTYIENEEPKEVGTKKIYNCTYASLSANQKKAGLEITAIQYELAELCLISVPEPIKRMGVTVMCGPYFSVMPFPMKPGFHSLSHVRWTPHYAWEGLPRIFENRPASNYQHMIRDAGKYLPLLNQAEFSESIFEVKALLPRTEKNDGRPILFQKQLQGDWVNILGGKIDNVYDVFESLSQEI